MLGICYYDVYEQRDGRHSDSTSARKGKAAELRPALHLSATHACGWRIGSEVPSQDSSQGKYACDVNTFDCATLRVL